MTSTKSDRDWSVYVGDEVRFLQAWFDPTSLTTVANGTKARVLDIDDKTRSVKLLLTEDNKQVKLRVPEADEEQAFGPAYASHAMKTQGDEAPIILAMPGKHTTSASSR